MENQPCNKLTTLTVA